MKLTLLRVALLALPLGLGACADFNEQTLYLYHDQERDQLHLLILYQGIHYEGDPDESKKQLDEFFSQPWHLVIADHWLGHLRRDRLVSDLANFTSSPAEKRVSELLLRNLEVANGRFYQDDATRLCGYQRVTLRKASEFMQALNALVSEVISQEPLKGKAPYDFSERTRALFAQAASRRHPWFSLDGQSIRFRCPFDDGDYRRWKKAILSDAREARTEDFEQVRAYITENDLSLIREGEWVTVVLGNPRAKGPIRLVAKPRRRDSENNLIDHVRGKHGVDAALKEKDILDEFTSSLLGEDRVRRIDALILELGSDDFDVREEASKGLEGFGKLAAPALRKASLSRDAEVRARASTLLAEMPP